MKGNNEIIFCEDQMIEALKYYFVNYLFNSAEFKSEVTGVKLDCSNVSNSFVIKLEEIKE